MRLLIFELRPPVLDREGLVAAIRARLEEVEERPGQYTDLHTDGDLHLTPEMEAALYRIAQVALNNVLKHAEAQRIIVSLVQNGDSVILEVIDDGMGFDMDSGQSTSTFGLKGMQERVANLGGSIDVHSKPVEGTRVKVEIST